MIYLLDTNALSDLATGRAQILDRLDLIGPDDQTVTTSICLGELRFGIELLPFAKRRAELERQFAKVVSEIHILDVRLDAAVQYGRVRTLVERRGRALSGNDQWIASVTLALDATLVTRDRDFDAIAELRRVDWSITSP